MTRNKSQTVFLLLILISIIAGGYGLYKNAMPKSPKAVLHSHAAGTENPIEYWTCSMHPQVRKEGPGKCPICGMDLVPIYAQDKDKLVIDSATVEKLGIRSQPAAHINFTKILRLPGTVSHDFELYTLQQEYLSTLSSYNKLKDSASSEIIERERALLEATKLRLKLLGFDDTSIQELARTNKPDKSLIYPSQGRAWIHADVYAQDINLVKPGQTITAYIKGYDSEIFNGEIKAVATTLDVQTRAAKARIEVSDPANTLKRELYADVRVEIELGHRLGVPRKSLIDTGLREIVYLDLGGGRYQIREVSTGVEAQGYIEIVSGLQEGDLVVADGNFLLDSQTTLTGGQSLLYGSGEAIPNEPVNKPQHRH